MVSLAYMCKYLKGKFHKAPTPSTIKKIARFTETNGITEEWCNSVNIKINDATINRTKQSTEKALADFRKLSALYKYKECIHYGNFIIYNDIKTTDGWLTLKTFEIYGTKFIFILLAGEVINCYELQ